MKIRLLSERGGQSVGAICEVDDADGEGLIAASIAEREALPDVVSSASAPVAATPSAAPAAEAARELDPVPVVAEEAEPIADAVVPSTPAESCTETPVVDHDAKVD